MPSNVPERKLNVYMVGAGLSAAFGISNTPSLLTELVRFSKRAEGKWLSNERLRQRLEESYKYFYPDAEHPGFLPDPVDYFSTLRTFIDVSRTFSATGFPDAPDLYRTLKRGIAHLLITEIRNYGDDRLKNHAYLMEVMAPGNVVITSNWDTLLERYAQLNDIQLRLGSTSREFPNTTVHLLKLHGSIDWLQVPDRRLPYPDTDYASLQELQNPAGQRKTLSLPTSDDALVRIRTTPNQEWNQVRSRGRNPWMVTMVTGKQDDLGPLEGIWRDAYRALNRAESLKIVGYSLPPDDVEIRTLLRMGIRRGIPELNVKNPAPDVHQRVRQYLDRGAQSDYRPVPES